MNNQKRHIELAIEALKVMDQHPSSDVHIAIASPVFDFQLKIKKNRKQYEEAIEYLESILYIFVEDKEDE